MVRDTSLAVPKRDSRAAVHAMLALDKLSVNTKAHVSFASILGLFCLYTKPLLTRCPCTPRHSSWCLVATPMSTSASREDTQCSNRSLLPVY
jgi:hypothetical protein